MPGPDDDIFVDVDKLLREMQEGSHRNYDDPLDDEDDDFDYDDESFFDDEWGERDERLGFPEDEDNDDE